VTLALAAWGTSGPTFASAPSCGEEGNAPNSVGRQCLLDAFEAGTAASFVSRLTSIEGDPIIRTYLVTGAGAVLIAHDARQDAFGSGKIEYLRCPRLAPVADWNRTQVFPVQVQADMVFVEDGCVEIAT
jgi:hypothetical protein